MTKEPKRSFELTIHHRSESITHLIEPGSQEIVSGMVTIESYFPWLFRRIGFETEGMIRLLRLALEHAIPQVLSSMQCKRFSCLGKTTGSEHFLGSVSNSIDSCCLTPLPELRTIRETYAKALAIEGRVNFTTLDKGMLVGDLPKVSLHLQSLAMKCPCQHCCTCTQRYHNPLSNNDFCYKEDFFRSLSFITTEILVLSLFQSSEPILVKASLERRGGYPGLDSTISKVIKTEDTFEFDDMDLLDWVRSIIGHDYDDEERSLTLTSGKGQVIHPIVFSTFNIEKHGYLKLCCLSGTLRYENDTFNVVSTSEDIGYTLTSDLDLPVWPEVFQPVNLFRNFKLSWDLTVQDNRELHVRLILIGTSGRVIAQMDPLNILLALRDSLVLERCPHDCLTPLKDTDSFASYTAPWCEVGEDSDLDTQDSIASYPKLRISVRAVDGAEDLRCFGWHLVESRVSCGEALVFSAVLTCVETLISKVLFCESSLLQEPDSEYDHRNENSLQHQPASYIF